MLDLSTKDLLEILPILLLGISICSSINNMIYFFVSLSKVPPALAR